MFNSNLKENFSFWYFRALLDEKHEQGEVMGPEDPAKAPESISYIWSLSITFLLWVMFITLNTEHCRCSRYLTLQVLKKWVFATTFQTSSFRKTNSFHGRDFLIYSTLLKNDIFSGQFTCFLPSLFTANTQVFYLKQLPAWNLHFRPS